MKRILVFARVFMLFSVLTVTTAIFRASAPKALPLTKPIQCVRPYREAQASDSTTGHITASFRHRLRRPVL